MNIYLLLILLGICCFVLSFALSKCQQRWGPWVLLAGIVALLTLVVIIIYCLILL